MRSLASSLLAGLVAGAVLSGCGGSRGEGDAAKTSRDSVWSAPKRWWAGMRERDAETKTPAVEVARTAPGVRSNHRDRALDLMQKQRFRKAIHVLDEWLDEQPGHHEARTLKADCHYQLKQIDEAIELYEEVLAAAPGQYPARRGVGFAYLNQGHQQLQQGVPAKAFSAYTKSLRIFRSCAEVLPGDGRAAYGRCFAAEALARFYHDRAVKLRARGDHQGGETMFDKCVGFCTEALDAARRYQVQAPRDVGPRAVSGRILKQMAMLAHEFGQFERAVISLKKSRQAWLSILRDIDPHHRGAQEEADACLILLGRWEAQRKALRGMEGSPAE